MRIIKRCILIISFALIFISYFSIPYLVAFDVGPGKADFTVTAGEECSKEFFINNSEEGPICIKATLTDIVKVMPNMVNSEGGSEFVQEKEYLLSKFSKIYPEKLFILPGNVGKINLKITMPKDAKGEYYGSIFFESLPDEKEGTIGVSSRIGMALYIAIEGTEIFKCDIGDFKILSTDPLKFKLNVKNLGNVHIRPEGYVTFRGKQSVQEFQVVVNEIHGPILPNTEVDIGNKKTDVKLIPGKYTASIHLEYGKEGILDKGVDFNMERYGVRP